MIPEQTLLGFPLFGDNATKVEPDNNKKSNGWQQGDVVPAEWMNWEWYHASKGVADLNKGVNSMEKEINAVLASFGISPAEATNNQLLTAMRLNASFVTATGTTITGPLLVSGGTIRVMFTAAIAGSDTTTGLTISYNGQSIAVKVGKGGSLLDFCAHEIATNEFKYLQAYTTLELVYDGVQFIIVGNPIVLSGSDYTIYADGSNVTNKIINNNYNPVSSDAVFNRTSWTLLYSGNLTNANTINITKSGWTEIVIMTGSPNYRYSIIIPNILASGTKVFWLKNEFQTTNNQAGCVVTFNDNLTTLTISSKTAVESGVATNGFLAVYCR